MSDYVLVSDSSCDLPKEFVKKHNIGIIPYYVTLDGETYLREGFDISNEEFYSAITKSERMPKTSLPTIQNYLDIFEPIASAGKDILCICLTAKFSGSFQSANNAAMLIMEKYPERKVMVADSTQASFGQGLIVMEAARLKEEGISLENNFNAVEAHKETGRVFLTVDSLEYLQKGGRIGKASALAGGILGIKPIIVMKDGELNPISKIRGRKKALNQVVKLAISDLEASADDYIFAVGHSDCKTEAHGFKYTLSKDFGLLVNLPIFEVGVTIGAHVGPTVLGMAYIKKFRV